MIAPKISDLVGLLADYLKTHDLTAGSVRQLRITGDLFTRWYAEAYAVPFNLCELNERTVGEFLFWLRDTRKAEPTTCNRKRGDLLTLWRYAARLKLLERPDPADVIRFRQPERMPTAWQPHELTAFLEACAVYKRYRPIPHWDARHDRAVLLVLYETAFRISACLSLTTDNLRDDGAIIARAETQKTFADEARFLSPATLAALRAAPPHAGRLFPWPYSVASFRARWKAFLRLAGLPTTRRDGPQKLRRTSASWVEAAQPGSAQRHLGHRTAGLAAKHYIDPRIAGPPKASELLPRIGLPRDESRS